MNFVSTFSKVKSILTSTEVGAKYKGKINVAVSFVHYNLLQKRVSQFLSPSCSMQKFKKGSLSDKNWDKDYYRIRAPVCPVTETFQHELRLYTYSQNRQLTHFRSMWSINSICDHVLPLSSATDICHFQSSVQAIIKVKFLQDTWSMTFLWDTVESENWQ